MSPPLFLAWDGNSWETFAQDLSRIYLQPIVQHRTMNAAKVNLMADVPIQEIVKGGAPSTNAVRHAGPTRNIGAATPWSVP